MTLAKSVVLATLVALAGCSSNPSAREEAIVGLAVQYATAKYIERKPSSRKEIAGIAQAAKAVIGGDATATLLTLQEAVGNELDKLSLSPADRVLANALVNLIVAELQAKVGDGLLDADQRVRIVSVLDLIIATAQS